MALSTNAALCSFALTQRWSGCANNKTVTGAGNVASKSLIKVLESVQDELRVDGVIATVECHENIPEIHASHTQMQQVILNLIENAIEAMRLVALDNRRLRLVTGFDGKSISVYVQDSGIGISAERQNQIFEPFLRLNRAVPDWVSLSVGLLWKIMAVTCVFRSRILAAPVLNSYYMGPSNARDAKRSAPPSHCPYPAALMS